MKGKIKLVLNFHHQPTNTMKDEEVEWAVVPRIDEMVYYKEKSYKVTDILHSIDLGIITILLH